MDERHVLQLLSGLGLPFFGLGAVLFFTLMRRPWNRVVRYRDRGGAAQGVVVGHTATGISDSNRAMYSLVVEFRDRTGGEFRFTASGASTHPHPIGTPMDVAYDVSDPRRAVSIASARTLARIGTGMAALFGLLAAASGGAFALLH